MNWNEIRMSVQKYIFVIVQNGMIQKNVSLILDRWGLVEKLRKAYIPFMYLRPVKVHYENVLLSSVFMYNLTFQIPQFEQYDVNITGGW